MRYYARWDAIDGDPEVSSETEPCPRCGEDGAVCPCRRCPRCEEVVGPEDLVEAPGIGPSMPICQACYDGLRSRYDGD